ncbi:NAD-glutamate dehydrogenase [Dermacoccaceae bacterium W4C1]
MSTETGRRSDLLLAASTQADDRAAQACQSYYRHVADEDLRDLGPDRLAGILRSHTELASRRQAGQTCLRLWQPSLEQDGWSCPYAVLQIVTDDMPFLVDSVTACLSRHDRAVHFLVHPQVHVRRDEDGQLLQILDEAPETPEADQVRQESWIHLEIDLTAAGPQDQALEQEIAAVLHDVRAAVEDFPQMTERAHAAAEQAGRPAPAQVTQPQIEQTRAFLEWMAGDHFVFLGYREYTLESRDGIDHLVPVVGSGLGLLRSDDSPARPLSGRAAERARDGRLLMLTKANSRSTVHRPSYLDYVGIKVFNAAGEVVGERRFLGLYTSRAYSDPLRTIPVLRERVREVLERSGFDEHGHSGRDLLQVLETFPRDELMQSDAARLTHVVTQVLRLTERRRSALFLRPDDYGRFISALVYIPRDRFNTHARLRMEAILKEAFAAETVDWTTSVGESTLARLHFVLRLPRGQQVPDMDSDFAELESRLIDATHSWGERLGEQSRAEDGDAEAARVVSLYSRAFPEAYKEDFTPRQGVADLRRLEALDGPADTLFTLYREPGADGRERRFKLFRRSPVILTDVMPVFTDLGVEVTDERPYEMDRADGQTVWIYDFGLRAPTENWWGGAQEQDRIEVRDRFQQAFAAVWEGRADSDGYNALVLQAGLTWREVAMLRALARYLRQIGNPFSERYLIESLRANVDLARDVVALFVARFDPDLTTSGSPEEQSEYRRQAQDAVLARIDAGLEQVASLDQDRIVRAFTAVVQAILRTNMFCRDAEGNPRPVMSFKIDPRAVPEIPSPAPMFEIWVSSPRVEGVHLRFGTVARGGLRWSDRLEDFRTEVLGLVKAQMVKNAVIVPTGSKGGFVARRLPDASDREAWLAEGQQAYRQFIAGLLDVTDNLVAGAVVPPAKVVRHDPDDTYLVVAADKGTATFSDLANSVAREYDFWLDDAFASGGSAGYDHKAMGITARGAWESVKRHFRELGIDCQTQDFTAAGIGDMSGDVFGNGMLLSEHTRLVAAFDHRHIFVDPDPDAAASYAERRRLFELPRSSWADYDTALISAGGGVWPRTAKSIPVSASMIRALGLPDGTTTMTPNALITAVLSAPVDLLWNGGIGTYVKSAVETDAQIGDRANDAIRINGNQLRCRIVGEGGNLGLSQLGRIEAARGGVLVNTDAIDNSAGVDTSDHEVNIKILLTDPVRDGDLSLPERNELLASMTDEVGAMVLRDNYEQNTLLGNARAQEGSMLPVHRRLMERLTERGELDRSLEFLPDDAELDARAEAGEGLSAPELSVLLAYSKLALKADLSDSDIADDPWFVSTVAEYFPHPLRQAYEGQMLAHPLRAQIVVNSVVNSLVNRGGITFAHRAQEETGADPVQIVRGYVVAREVFDLAGFVADVEALDNLVPTRTQTWLYLEFRRLIDRVTRWLLHARPARLDIGAEVERFGEQVHRLAARVPDLLAAGDRERWESGVQRLLEEGVPTQLAERGAILLDLFPLMDIVERSRLCGEPAESVAELYYALSGGLGIDQMLNAVSQLPREDHWDALARAAVRDDVYSVLDSLTAAVLAATDPNASAQERVRAWSEANEGAIARGQSALSGLTQIEKPTLAALSVALRTLRSVIRSGAAT